MNLLKAYKLQNVRDQSIEIAGTVDINTLTKRYNCVTAGIKFINIELAYPITGNVLNITMSNVDNNVLS